ncbi:hypothetical protein ACQV5J_11165 [Leptospira interrogans]|uniref:hypothetical protein n=1 Tax=Leptospira interrogans TaxID=173 RepID=UPI003EBFD80E
MWGWLWLSNSASHSPRIVRQIAFGTQQNALYGSRLELSRTLSYGSRSRLKLKAKYRITFLSYNLLTKTENAAGFIQAFLL